MEHPTATLGQMKIKKSLNVQVSINFISVFPLTVSTRKMVSLFALKLLRMYFKFLVSIKFHAWVIFFSYFECQVINLIKVHNTPADKDWIFLIVQPCWSPLIVTTKQFLFSIATQIDANMILQNYPSNISDFSSFSASINSIESLLLCPLPFSASVFRSCLVRNRVKVTAWGAGSCRSWLLSLWLSSPASWPGCSVQRGRGRADWSWSDHQGGQLAACSSYPDQSIPPEKTFSVSNLANFLRFSDSRIFMKHGCNNCSTWLQRLQRSVPHNTHFLIFLCQHIL